MSNALPHGRYWINAPATTQPYHEYHGFIGILSGDSFFFADGVKGHHQHDATSIYAGDLLCRYLSEGWPDHLRRGSDQVTDLNSTLAEIGKVLSEHPDFQRGNSKIHYCAHKALGAAQ